MIALCRAETVVHGQIVQVRDDRGRPLTLTRLADGAIVAIDGRCPHRNGPLWAGRVAGDTIECPWHGFKFDLKSGACAGLQSIMQLVRYPVIVSDGIVYIEGDKS